MSLTLIEFMTYDRGLGASHELVGQKDKRLAP